MALATLCCLHQDDRTPMMHGTRGRHVGRHPEEDTLGWIANADSPALPVRDGDHVLRTWLVQPGYFSGNLVYRGNALIEQAVIHDGNKFSQYRK